MSVHRYEAGVGQLHDDHGVLTVRVSVPQSRVNVSLRVPVYVCPARLSARVACTHVFMLARASTGAQLCAHIQTRVCTHVHTYMYKPAQMPARMCAHAHTHVGTHR